MARLLAALPLLRLDLDVPTQHTSWTRGDSTAFGQEFVFRNRTPADRIVFAARLPTILITLALGLALVLWTRRVFGAAAALGALLLFAFDPNFIANGRYVKEEMLVTLLGFVSVIAWVEYLARGKRWCLAATGIAFGLALSAKFSALFLLPVFAICWFIARWRRKLPPAPLRCILALTAVTMISAAPLLLVYAPESHKLVPATRAYRAVHPEVQGLDDAITANTIAASTLVQASARLGLQDHALLVGFAKFLEHTSLGHEAYLLGQLSRAGWWYYFPVAFAVKTPVATLAAMALAGLIALHRLSSGRRQSPRIEWLLLMVPIAVYLPLTALTRVDIGERYLLPIYPFVFILTAAILTRATWRWRIPVGAALATMLVIESASIYPHYLAFFNFAVGGPDAGPRYLLDSNLDWGQDLLNLRDDWIARGRPKLCLLYFGTALPPYYGLPTEEVPRSSERPQRESADCVAAVSATPLYDLYMQPGEMAWLRERRPVAKIGYSIYLFDLRKHPPLDGR